MARKERIATSWDRVMAIPFGAANGRALKKSVDGLMQNRWRCGNFECARESYDDMVVGRFPSFPLEVVLKQKTNSFTGTAA